MKQLNVKKLVLLNLPYFLLGLFATNLGEAWRLAVGADASAKMLSFFSTLPVALGSWWPSLHPLDLAVGLCCGAGLRLAVYLHGKNAKKYRHNVEYGSARWGTHDDTPAPSMCWQTRYNKKIGTVGSARPTKRGPKRWTSRPTRTASAETATWTSWWTATPAWSICS